MRIPTRTSVPQPNGMPQQQPRTLTIGTGRPGRAPGSRISGAGPRTFGLGPNDGYGTILDLMITLLEETHNLPKILAGGEGCPFVLGPQHATIKLMSAETDGRFSLTEVRIDEPGFGPPYHVHTREDELFMVHEGSLILIVDGVRHEVTAGGMAYAPRDVPHRFESGPNGVRFTLMITGSNFERFYSRYAEAIERGDLASLPGIAADHGITFLPQD